MRRCSPRPSAPTSPALTSNEALLYSLYVVPEQWRDGIGTRLLHRGIATLPTGIDRLTVGVMPTNEIGYGFYRRHGFETVGETQVTIGGTPYGIDRLVRNV